MSVCLVIIMTCEYKVGIKKPRYALGFLMKNYFVNVPKNL